MSHQIWRGLNDSELKRVQTEHPWSRSTYTEGSIIALMGEPIDSLMIVEEGSISAEMPDPHGRLMKVESLHAGDMVAGPLLFSSEAKLPVQLVAETGVVLHYLPRQRALELLSQHPKVLENLLREAGDKITFLAEKLRMMKFSSISQKTAAHFLKLSMQQASDEIQLSYSIRELADLFGVERPSLSRSLAKLVGDGCIDQLDRGRYRIRKDLLKAILLEGDTGIGD